MNKRPLIFVGSRSKQALLNITAELNDYEILGILDHHYYGGDTTEINHVPYIGDERWLLDPNNQEAQRWIRTCDFFPATWWDGSQHINRPGPDMQELRLNRINILEQANVNVINLIHPRSIPLGSKSKYSSLNLGKGIFIDDDCWICPYNVSIGNYCCISMSAKLAAGAHLGFNVCVGPKSYLHHCKIGDDSYIGMYTTFNLRPDHSDIQVGHNVTTWVGSQISKDIPCNSIHTDTGRILKKISREIK